MTIESGVLLGREKKVTEKRSWGGRPGGAGYRRKAGDSKNSTLKTRR